MNSKDSGGMKFGIRLNKTKSFIGSLTAFSAAGRENDFPIWNAVVGLLPTFCRNTPSLSMPMASWRKA
jgi:hypothetical protein